MPDADLPAMAGFPFRNQGIGIPAPGSFVDTDMPVIVEMIDTAEMGRRVADEVRAAGATWACAAKWSVALRAVREALPRCEQRLSSEVRLALYRSGDAPGGATAVTGFPSFPASSSCPALYSPGARTVSVEVWTIDEEADMQRLEWSVDGLISTGGPGRSCAT
jgi:hypothetical protein